MTHPAIAVYSKPNCPPCAATKRKLDQYGATYTAVDITEDQGAYDFVLALGAKETPVVVLEDGTHWTGYDPDRIKSAVAQKEDTNA